MRTSRLTTTLAVILYVSPVRADELPQDAAGVGALIRRTSADLGPDGAQHAWAELAYAYGDHPETAAARMSRCLQAVTAARTTAPVPSQRQGVTR